MTWDEAVAAVLGPDGPYETVEVVRDGRSERVFARAPATLRDLFGSLRQRDPDAAFLVFEDEVFTIGEVLARIDGFATALVERYGIAPGDRVAIAMRNYPEWIVAFGAVVFGGCDWEENRWSASRMAVVVVADVAAAVDAGGKEEQEEDQQFPDQAVSVEEVDSWMDLEPSVAS